MTTVLIATDFSKASRNATLYGVQLAKEINANIILFNAYDIPTPAAGLKVGISRYSVSVQIDKKLKDEAETFNDMDIPSIATICDEGNAEDAIINVANNKKVDFIVIGMKGRGKNFKKIFGSTATSLSKRTNIPVIIVPEYATFKAPHNIAFANDVIIDSEKDVPEDLKKIALLFKSKLNIVKVIKNKHSESLQTSNNADKPKVVYTFDTSFEYPVNTDLRQALNDFIEEYHCDLLVMMPRKHKLMERLFRKSETKNMIFHTHVPLLVLPETPVNRI
jgi:nucleotide-binding universal stress UspA family protein